MDRTLQMKKKRIYLQLILITSIACDVIDVLFQCSTGHENNVYEDLEHHWYRYM